MAETAHQRLAQTAAKYHEIPCAEADGSQHEKFSECPLIYVRCHHQDVAEWPRRGGVEATRILAVLVDHSAVGEQLSVRPQRVRSVTL